MFFNAFFILFNFVFFQFLFKGRKIFLNYNFKLSQRLPLGLNSYFHFPMKLLFYHILFFHCLMYNFLNKILKKNVCFLVWISLTKVIQLVDKNILNIFNIYCVFYLVQSILISQMISA